MTTVNHALAGLVRALMSVLGSLSPVFGLAILSLVTALALLLVVRVASNQAGIAAVKRSIRAALFEMRLFNDDLRAILRAQGEILRHNLTYLRLSLVPMLWVLVPLLLLMTQLQAYYGYGSIDPGDTALVKVELDDEWRPAQSQAAPDLTLEAPPGLRVETPRVWIPSLNEAAWRIRAERPGDYELTVTLHGTRFTKRVHVSEPLVSRTPVRPKAGSVDELLHPVEAPLPRDSHVSAITVTYPERGVPIAGRDIHWIIVFAGLTMIFAFGLKSRFGVVL